MAEVTLTATLKKAIRDEIWSNGASVFVRLARVLESGGTAFLLDGRGFKVDDDGELNDNGVGVPVPEEGDGTALYRFLFPRQVPRVVAGNPAARKRVVYDIFVDDAHDLEIAASDDPLALENLLAVGSNAPNGGQIVVSGLVKHPFDDTPWKNDVVLVELTDLFTTTGGVFPRVTDRILIDENGYFYGEAGLTLHVPEGRASKWRFTFPDGTVVTALLDASLSTVSIGAVLIGTYTTWTEPMAAPGNPQLAVSGVNKDQVTFTWDDNSSDESGFEVWTSENGTVWNLLTTTAAGIETYTHTTAHGTHPLNLGLATLRYRVRAVKSGGASAWATKTETAKGLLFRLKAAYNLNEASSTRGDILGGYPLTQEVGAAGSATGLIGDAVDGSNNVRLRNDSYSIPSGTPFAITLWVYWGGSSGADNRIIGLYPDATGELLRIITGTSNTLVINQVNGTSATLSGIELDEWNLIVFGYDGTNTVYSVNGAAKQTLYAGAWTQNWSRLWVGSENTNSTYLVDLLNWYYNHFPSAAQITALYNSGAGLAYPFS